MEPLAVVSLAGNVLQFVQTTRQLVSASRQISDDGMKHEYLELETIAQELRSLAQSVVIPGLPEDNTIPSETRQIRSLSHQCEQIAKELLDVLEKLKLKGNHNKFGSLYQALIIEWKKEEIESLQRRLDRISRIMNSHTLQYYHRKIFSRLNELAKENRRLEVARASDIKELNRNFDVLFAGTNTDGSGRDTKEVSPLMLRIAAAKGLQYSAEQIILEQLRFDRIDDRHFAIPSAHDQTLSWLFSSGQAQRQQIVPTTFSQWLGSEDDLYWISGKPGSGKSTLMKFLSSHKQTKKILQSWAKEEDKVICAEYFFWNAGKNYLQKSQEGLLRSLLYQILRQRPEMIRSTYPELCRVYGSSEANDWSKQSEVVNLTVPVTVKSLFGTLERICALLSQSEDRLVFFIDGLDEYEGKPANIIELISLLRTLPDIKLCVSSRPWNEFEQTFGKDQTKMLYMQDFNSGDISAYIYDTFSKDENFQELEDKDTQGKKLIQEIVDAAKGVFLWVFLVVRSFQEGLQNGDSISDLQRRLRSLPSDLNEYFDRILFSDVNDFYRRQSARIFFVTLETRENLPLMAYWFMGEEDPEFSLNLETRPLTMEQAEKRLKDMRKRLNACCKGLLEAQYPLQNLVYSLPGNLLFSWKVDFLHRTVRDYLTLPDTELLLKSWDSADFNPHEAICKAVLAQLKIAPQRREYYVDKGPIVQLYRLFQFHATALGDTSSATRTQGELRRQIETVMAVHYSATAKEDKLLLQLETAPDAHQDMVNRSISQTPGDGSEKSRKSGETSAVKADTTDNLLGSSIPESKPPDAYERNKQGISVHFIRRWISKLRRDKKSKGNSTKS